MAKFNFRLSKVHDVSLLKEKESQKEFSEAARKLTEEQECLDELKLEIKEEYKKSRKQFSKSFEAKDAVIRSNFDRKLQRTKIERENIVKGKRKVVEEKREQLSEAMKRRKMVEKLKEKKLYSYKEKEKRIEQKELDDMAGRRHIKANPRR
ncbi:flagellar export protein FliJ [bacterium]|nr:flagellar export protein FliJ [bacterium]